MKQCLFVILSSLFFFAHLQAQNQNFSISGPELVCAGSCATFLLEPLAGGSVPDDADVIWSIHGPNGGSAILLSSEGKIATICFDLPGTYVIFAEITTSPTGPVFAAQYPVFVTSAPALYIGSESQCNNGTTNPPPGDCQKVCANSEVSYFAYDLTGAQYFIQWSVSGAESFEPDSFQGVTVQWGNPGFGSVSAFGGYNDLCVAEQSICVEILEDAKASFETQPQSSGNELRVCQGQTVQFLNTSQYAEHFFWELGPFGSSTETNEAATFSQPGTYEIRLIANNACFCQADTASLTLIVEDAESPLLDCIGTICAGETVTYTSATDCGTYNWQISGVFNIVDGGGPTDNFITIEWLDGPEGTIELSVEDCANAGVCLEPAIRQIPILAGNAEVEGPERVCLGQSTVYSVIPYEGTEFTWTVSNFGTITSGQGANSVSVEWFSGFFPSQVQWVAVEYSNCYLGCGGVDTILVSILPEFYITGPIEGCAGGTYNYQAVNTQTNAAVSGNWTLRAPDGTEAWNSGGPTASPAVVFPAVPGVYSLSLSADNPLGFCTDGFEIRIEVKTPPPAPAAIDGETMICPGNTYAYEATGVAGNFSVRWEINNGGATSTRFGNPLNVDWGPAGPYALTVVLVSTDGLGCESAPLTLNLNALSGFTIAGDPEVCLDQVSSFSTQSYAGVDYLWSVSPVGAGTITGDPTQPAVDILWHTAGPATVNVAVCGQNAAFPVTVHSLPEPVVVHPAELCPNTTALVQTTQPFDSYEWLDENDGLLSSQAAPNLGAGYLQVRVTDSFGCVGDTTFYIDGHPASVINISTPDPTNFCGVPPQAALFALNSSAGYTYQWYLNGNPVGGNSPALNANAFGNYQVGITDAYGCTFLSGLIGIDSCGTGGGGGSPGGVVSCVGADLDFDTQPGSACNVRQYFNQSSGYDPGSLKWFYSLAGSDAWTLMSINDDPVFTYEKAGFYRVAVSGDYTSGGITSTCGFIQVDTVVAAADFEVDNACPGEVVAFFDLSTFLPVASISSWTWDFGDPASGAGNTSVLQNPTHVFSTPGSYLISLTVTANTGCTSTITRQLEVYPPPPVFFAEPQVNCEGTAIAFQADVPANVSYVAWDFGDPSSGDANQSELYDSWHIYGTPGDYSATLTAMSIYGCSNTFNRTLTITPNGLTGDITLSLPTPLCQGDTTILSPPPGGIAWTWSDSSETANLPVAETGVYAVTLTDAEGCAYEPAPVRVDVIEAPEAPIRAVTYNDYGQPAGYQYDGLGICEGEPVYLETVVVAQYSYVWSNGETGAQIEFTETRNNLLPEGTHEIFLTVTDNTTGCSNVIGPFVIEVHPLPAGFQITASNPGLICEGTETTFSVASPQPGLTYVWNNGATGPAMTTSQPGAYYAVAANAFGCSSQSNSLNILEGPDISKIPSGCHTRCNPDTICFPALPGISSYQWYFNGSPVAGPEGQMPQLVAAQSGDYHVQMVSNVGCTLNSGTLSLDLLEGFGTIRGNVYFDLNEDGIIDPADSLMTGVNIRLTENNTPVSQQETDSAGGYQFVHIPAGGYTVSLDTAGLDPGVRVYQVSADTVLTGCGTDDIRIDFLCYLDCASLNSEQNIVLCPGESFFYNGASYGSDTTFTTQFTTAYGCDSTEVVSITVSAPDTTFISIPACAGTVVSYEQQLLEPGSSTAFHFPNQYGCDSVVLVGIPELPVQAESIILQACEGETVLYEGLSLSPGETRVFTYDNQFGCDSTISVSVTQLPVNETALELKACSGTMVVHDGVNLLPGQQMDFVYDNQSGCDSTVSVRVIELPVYQIAADFQACQGSSITYNGVTIPAGQSYTFNYLTAEGCDSIIQVGVEEIDGYDQVLNLSICPGETIEYGGVSLQAGDNRVFNLISQGGCDSVVTVSVVGFPELNFTAESSPTCSNAATGTVRTIFTGPVPAGIQYSLDGITYQDSPEFNGLMPGDYTVVVRDANGCTAEGAPIPLASLQPLVVEVEPQVFPCDQSPVVLSAGLQSGSDQDVTFRWSDGTEGPLLEVDEPGVYILTAANSCETISVEGVVGREYSNDLRAIYVPNAFSPNEDTENALFRAYPGEQVQVSDFVLMVFDRWGNQVFQTEDLQTGWDGRVQGRQMPTSVYVWRMQAEIEVCGEKRKLQQEGDLMLIR